jgi:hypothetical protein
VVVISQPDSPIELVKADLTGVELTVSDRSFNYSLSGPNQFDVRNLSDSVIEQIEVGLFIGRCGAPGGPPRRGGLWRGSLMPGAMITITTNGNASGSGSFGQPFIAPGRPNGTAGGTLGGGVLPATSAGADAVHVFIAIERVDIGACVYRPSQVLPRSICGF